MGFRARKNQENWRVVSRTALWLSLFSEQGRYRWLQIGPAIRTEKESQLSSFDRKRIVVNIDKMNRNNLVTHGGYVKFEEKSLTQIKGSTMSKMPKFK